MTIRVLFATTVRWPSAGRLAGAFAAAGCAVDIVLPARHPAARSRFFTHHHSYHPLRGVTSLRAAMRTASYDLVIPLDDRAVALLLQLRESAAAPIAALIDRSLGKVAAYGNLISRAGFIESARQADIRAPTMRALTSQADLESALSEIGFPAVLKADGTWGGDGVIIANSRAEALAAFRRLSEPPSRLRSIVRAVRRSDAHHLLAAMKATAGTISIQQFIPGIPTTTAMACWEGKLLAANHLEVVVARGATGPASVLRRIENADMDAAAARLAARFELSGLHGLDYIKDPQGRVHLIEINPRAPQSSYLSFGAGHDLAIALARRAGAPVRAPRPSIINDTIALFPQEWMRDPTSPYLKSAYHDVPWDDPPLIRSWISSAQARPTREKWEQFLASRPAAPRLETGQS